MLGSYISRTEDTKQRLKRGGGAWAKAKNQLRKSKMKKSMQARVVQAVVESTILFDCQARPWRLGEINRIQRFMD